MRKTGLCHLSLHKANYNIHLITPTITQLFIVPSVWDCILNNIITLLPTIAIIIQYDNKEEHIHLIATSRKLAETVAMVAFKKCNTDIIL